MGAETSLGTLEITKEDTARLSLLLRLIEKPVKVQVILLLYVEPQLTDKQIYARLKYSPAILGTVLKSCVKYGLAENKQGRYELTKVGRKVAEFLIELTETAKEELWRS